MLDEILGMFKVAFEACFSWLDQIIEATGTFSLIIGVFTIYVMTRLLIVPILGGQTFSGLSDTYNKAVARKRERDYWRNQKVRSGNPEIGDGKK